MTSTTTPCVRCYITGKVQGVLFRATTQAQAQRLKLTGYVCNLSSGGVEVVACGNNQALADLQSWLVLGPPAARVDRVDCTTLTGCAFKTFEIR